MRFTVTDELPFERELVFETHRDKIIELVPYLPNVDGIVVRERVEDGDVVKLTNEWSGSSSDVPGVLQTILKPELLTWTDRAVWDQSTWRADWQITINALPEAVTAKGSSVFTDEGGDTLVEIHGEFVLHPERVPAVPGFIARRAAPALERFIVGLLQPNLKRSNQAVLQHLEDHA